MLTAYENAHSRIAKIETSIKKQQNFGTKDQNSDADNDQTGLKDESVGNGPKNKVLTVTENENKNKFPLNLRVLSLTVIETLVSKMVMSVMMATNIKLYVNITQLENVSTEGLDLIVGIATQKSVEGI